MLHKCSNCGGTWAHKPECRWAADPIIAAQMGMPPSKRAQDPAPPEPPDVIYLQWSDDSADVTWCSDRVHDSDLRYIRADKA